MASQVLSGTGPVSYTNNTGENVRVVINFLEWSPLSGLQGPTGTIVLSWGAGSVAIDCRNSGAIGRNLAFSLENSQEFSTNSASAFAVSNNGIAFADGTYSAGVRLISPTEVMLAPGGTFSTSVTGAATDSNIKGYNIVVIPEGG